MLLKLALSTSSPSSRLMSTLGLAMASIRYAPYSSAFPNRVSAPSFVCRNSATLNKTRYSSVSHITQLVPSLIIALLQNIINHLNHFLQDKSSSTLSSPLPHYNRGKSTYGIELIKKAVLDSLSEKVNGIFQNIICFLQILRERGREKAQLFVFQELRLFSCLTLA